MTSPFTPEQIAAREKLWRASQDGVGITLTRDEAAYLWGSIFESSVRARRDADALRDIADALKVSGTQWVA